MVVSRYVASGTFVLSTVVSHFTFFVSVRPWNQSLRYLLVYFRLGNFWSGFGLGLWFLTFFDAFLPLLILELFIPPLFEFVG